MVPLSFGELSAPARWPSEPCGSFRLALHKRRVNNPIQRPLARLTEPTQSPPPLAAVLRPGRLACACCGARSPGPAGQSRAPAGRFPAWPRERAPQPRCTPPPPGAPPRRGKRAGRLRREVSFLPFLAATAAPRGGQGLPGALWFCTCSEARTSLFCRPRTQAAPSSSAAPARAAVAPGGAGRRLPEKARGGAGADAREVKSCAAAPRRVHHVQQEEEEERRWCRCCVPPPRGCAEQEAGAWAFLLFPPPAAVLLGRTGWPWGSPPPFVARGGGGAGAGAGASGTGALLPAWTAVGNPRRSPSSLAPAEGAARQGRRRSKLGGAARWSQRGRARQAAGCVFFAHRSPPPPERAARLAGCRSARAGAAAPPASSSSSSSSCPSFGIRPRPPRRRGT